MSKLIGKAESPQPSHSVSLNRRSVFAGAGAVGALAAAAAVIPGTPELPQAVAQGQDADASTGGYQVTPHVLRYYHRGRSAGHRRPASAAVHTACLSKEHPCC